MLELDGKMNGKAAEKDEKDGSDAYIGGLANTGSIRFTMEKWHGMATKGFDTPWLPRERTKAPVTDVETTWKKNKVARVNPRLSYMWQLLNKGNSKNTSRKGGPNRSYNDLGMCSYRSEQTSAAAHKSRFHWGSSLAEIGDKVLLQNERIHLRYSTATCIRNLTQERQYLVRSPSRYRNQILLVVTSKVDKVFEQMSHRWEASV
jgi:hypothetical protein